VQGDWGRKKKYFPSIHEGRRNALRFAAARLANPSQQRPVLISYGVPSYLTLGCGKPSWFGGLRGAGSGGGLAGLRFRSTSQIPTPILISVSYQALLGCRVLTSVKIVSGALPTLVHRNQTETALKLPRPRAGTCRVVREVSVVFVQSRRLARKKSMSKPTNLFSDNAPSPSFCWNLERVHAGLVSHSRASPHLPSIGDEPRHERQRQPP
jgi:hypothetical protein